jgi:hypothetical protein
MRWIEIEFCAIVYVVNRTIKAIDIVSLFAFIHLLLKNILLYNCKIVVNFSCIDRKVNLKTGKHKNIYVFFS